MNDTDEFLMHYGIKGMHWGVRRYQNEDSTRTPLGKRHEAQLESNRKPFNKELAKKVAIGVGAGALAVGAAVGIGSFVSRGAANGDLAHLISDVMNSAKKASMKKASTKPSKAVLDIVEANKKAKMDLVNKAMEEHYKKSLTDEARKAKSITSKAKKYFSNRKAMSAYKRAMEKASSTAIEVADASFDAQDIQRLIEETSDMIDRLR
jgi:hypothetical protein